MGRPPGTTVFVGNISYDTTEDQLKEVFSHVGTVVSFRLMYDHETGRAKGFGFCEYEDKETAMSARRNLNGTQLNGRPLRVDLTDSDKQIASANGLSLPSTTPTTTATPTPHTTPTSLPPELVGANPSMAMMPLSDIHQTMLHLKKALVQNPNELRELLVAHPRLAHAILQGQIMLGMVPPPMMPPPSQPHHPPAPHHPSAAPHHPSAPPHPAPPHHPPPPVQTPVRMPPPPAMQPLRGPPPPPPPPPPNVPAPSPGMSPAALDEQAAILNRVMAMTPQEIEALPPEHRNYVLELKDILHNPASAPMPGAPPMRPGPPPPQGVLPPGPPYR